jgi:hypothetical protein
VWTTCADTPTMLCAAWGKNCGDDHLEASHARVIRGNVIHRLCEKKTSPGFSDQ